MVHIEEPGPEKWTEVGEPAGCQLRGHSRGQPSAPQGQDHWAVCLGSLHAFSVLAQHWNPKMSSECLLLADPKSLALAFRSPALRGSGVMWGEPWCLSFCMSSPLGSWGAGCHVSQIAPRFPHVGSPLLSHLSCFFVGSPSLLSQWYFRNKGRSLHVLNLPHLTRNLYKMSAQVLLQPGCVSVHSPLTR